MKTKFFTEADLLVLERNLAQNDTVRGTAPRPAMTKWKDTPEANHSPLGKVSGTNLRPRQAPSPTFTPFQLALTGQLPSGKNQVQLLFRNGKVMKYPNKTFTNWRQRSTIQLLGQHATPLISKPVCLTVDYWPGDLKTRDVSGQQDALFHLLVYVKVLKDDGLIYDVTWRRRDLNRRFPKVVLEIAPWKGEA